MARRYALLLTPLLAGCALVAGIDAFESAATARNEASDGASAITMVEGNVETPPLTAGDATVDVAIDAGSPTPSDAAPPQDGGANTVPDAPPSTVSCANLADGTQWNPQDPTARCCGGVAVNVTSNDNCGACGIKCNTAYGQSCAQRNGVSYCLGCATAGVGITCWSLCCSTKYFTEGACVPDSCLVPGGGCVDSLCTARGATCHTSNSTSDYCGYD